MFNKTDISHGGLSKLNTQAIFLLAKFLPFLKIFVLIFYQLGRRLNIYHKLKVIESSSVDIPSYILREVSNQVSGPLRHAVNLYCLTSEFPNS